MLAHRLRRRPRIAPTMGMCRVVAAFLGPCQYFVKTESNTISCMPCSENTFMK